MNPARDGGRLMIQGRTLVRIDKRAALNGCIFRSSERIGPHSATTSSSYATFPTPVLFLPVTWCPHLGVFLSAQTHHASSQSR